MNQYKDPHPFKLL